MRRRGTRNRVHGAVGTQKLIAHRESAMDFNRAKQKLAEGHCLWVGAGVTKQLWPAALQWEELTRKLERLAGVTIPLSAHYPERLQSCSDKLGADVFRKHLRQIYYTDLCE